MGCMGSKHHAEADVALVDVYRPPPTSVSLFDISAVEEPWLIAKNRDADGDEEDDDDEEEEETDDDDEEVVVDEKTQKKAIVPLLEKLEGFELAPASWSEVSKALEDMKPGLVDSTNKPVPLKKAKTKKKKKKKNTKKQQPQPQVEKPAAAAKAAEPRAEENKEKKAPPPELAGRRVVKDNPFLMRDRENKEAGAPSPRWKRRDPFEGCPERRPPGAAGGGVVLYTTTLRGVRRTFEDCERARELVEACAEATGVPAVDERDVSLHGEYLRELRELAGEEGAPPPAPPRLFVMGRYVGGAEECARLAESGKLREMMRWAKARGDAKSFSATKDGRGCMGCGGARFVPCWECGGSCKVVAAGDNNVVERCPKCNENGLMMCPICH